MGIVILKKDRDASKSYDEAEELARRRYLINQNKRLYKNLRKFLQDASKAVENQDQDSEFDLLHSTLYGVQRRLEELKAKGIKGKLFNH